jgi:hypothetical protein
MLINKLHLLVMVEIKRATGPYYIPEYPLRESEIILYFTIIGGHK